MSRSHRKRGAAAQEPEPWLRYLSPELRDNAKSVAWAKAKHENEQALRAFHRTLVDFYEFYSGCRHLGCRRAHRCARPDVPCYDAALPMLRRHVFPWLLPALRQRQAASAARAPAVLRPESQL